MKGQNESAEAKQIIQMLLALGASSKQMADAARYLVARSYYRMSVDAFFSRGAEAKEIGRVAEVFIDQLYGERIEDARDKAEQRRAASRRTKTGTANSGRLTK